MSAFFGTIGLPARSELSAWPAILTRVFTAQGDDVVRRAIFGGPFRRRLCVVEFVGGDVGCNGERDSKSEHSESGETENAGHRAMASP
jgi:hypothetical protein